VQPRMGGALHTAHTHTLRSLSKCRSAFEKLSDRYGLRPSSGLPRGFLSRTSAALADGGLRGGEGFGKGWDGGDAHAG
jgi:hypothetical protein